MNRRELLKPLAALPFATFIIGQSECKAVEPSPGKFVVFMDVQSVEPEQFLNCLPEHPLAGSPVHFLYLRPEQTIEDAVAIYKVE